MTSETPGARVPSRRAQAEVNRAAAEIFEHPRKAEVPHFNLFAGAANDPSLEQGPKRNYYVCKVPGDTAMTSAHETIQ